MAIDPTTTTTIKVGDLQSAAYSTTDLIPHEVGGYLKKGNLLDLATFIGEIIDVTGGVGFRAVEVNDGETLPATEDQEFILVGPGTFPNVGGGATITTTEPLNALVSNGTYWFIGVEIPITASGVWGTISGVLTDQTDLNDVLDAKADLVDGKVPNSQLPSYVDDVVEVANFAALPATGETGKIYVTIDTGNVYRWSGSAYIRIADESPVWGIITGDLEDQTDLQNALNGKYPVPTGDTTQYIAGDGTLITFPVAGQAGTLVRLVRNNSGATITKGSVVYINGASGNNPTIAKAIATGDSTSAQTFGLVQADITNNSNGYVVVTGDLIGVNTSAIAEGSQLYLSSTTAGAYTTTKQLAPAHLVYIGVVTRSHATLGQIEVKIQNGYELDELHDVAISSKANNEVIVYESSTDLWKNKSLGTILGGTSSQFVKGNGSLDNSTYALDNVVVKLTGDQSIAGIKTFSTQIKSNILLINESGGFSGSTGYTQLGGTADYFQIVNSGGSKQTKFIHTGVRNITMPASDGTMALTSDIPTVSGTTNYIPKFTGASAIGNSLIFDNGTNVGIGTVSPGTKLDVRGNINIGNSADTGTNSFVIQSNKGIFQIDVDGATSGVGTKIKYTYGSGSQGSLRFVRALDEDTMILAANGNVGIGTTSPSFAFGSGLHVKSNSGWGEIRIEGQSFAGGTGSVISFTSEGTALADIYADTDKNLSFRTNGASERMRILANGNVGIGTTSPAAKLSVNGDLFLTSTGRSITFNSDTNLNTQIYEISGSINLYTGGQDRMRITSGGNVGIGTDSPNTLFEVKSTTSNAARIRVNNTSTTAGQYRGYEFASGTTFKGGLLQDQNTDLISIFTPIGGQSVNITSGGNVGIGTTSPGQKLTIGDGTNTGSQYLRVQGSGSDILIGESGGTLFGFSPRSAGYVISDNYTNPFLIGVVYSQPLVFGTANTERMRITSGGNLCIGTTSTTLSTTSVSAAFGVGGDATLKLGGYGGTHTQVQFIHTGSVQGSIVTTNGAGTAYNTSSDYRLKEDLKPINGLDLISQINVYDYKWKSNETRAYGVLAHELQEVIPQAVNGEKDGEQMQGVDYSKLVPILVQAIQDQQKQINELKTLINK